MAKKCVQHLLSILSSKHHHMYLQNTKMNNVNGVQAYNYHTHARVTKVINNNSSVACTHNFDDSVTSYITGTTSHQYTAMGRAIIVTAICARHLQQPDKDNTFCTSD